MERRGLVVALVYVCAACLAAMAVAPTLPLLITAQGLVGLSSISPQILIPLGAEMVPPAQRGKLIGTLMSGLLCGVLLARTVAGFVADHFGWRVLYAVAAVLMLILGLCLRISLPHARRRCACRTSNSCAPCSSCYARNRFCAAPRW